MIVVTFCASPLLTLELACAHTGAATINKLGTINFRFIETAFFNVETAADLGRAHCGDRLSVISKKRLPGFATAASEGIGNATPKIIVVSITSNVASNEPSPWSGEKPKYLSIKSKRR